MEVTSASPANRALRDLTFLVESSLNPFPNNGSETPGSNEPSPIPAEFLEMSDNSRLVVMGYTLLFFAAATGNVSVFYSVCRKLLKYGVKTRLTLLILHLSIADLIVTFFLIPMEIFWRVSVGWTGGNLLCKACQFGRAFGLYLSSMIIICISLDRYFAVMHPLRVFGARSTLRTTLILAWVAAALCSAPQILIFSVKQHPEYIWFEQCVTIGFFSSPQEEIVYNVFSISAMYFLPLAVILYAYSAILWKITSKTREQQQVLEIVSYSLRAKQETGSDASECLEGHPGPEALLGSIHPDSEPVLSSGVSTTARLITQVQKLSVIPSDPNPRILALRRSGNGICNITRARKRTLRLTIVITLTFLFCATPYVVMTLWYMFDRETAQRVDGRVQEGLFMMCVANSVLNPLIYGTYQNGQAWKELCRSRNNRKSPSSSTSSTTTWTSRGSVKARAKSTTLSGTTARKSDASIYSIVE